MLTLKVMVDGTPVPTTDRSEIESLYRFIGDYLRLTAQPASPVQEQHVMHVTPPQTEVSKPAPVSRKQTFGGHNPQPGERKIDYIIRALEAYPEGLSPVQILDNMFKAGWKTTSKAPLRLVQFGLYESQDEFKRLPTGKWILSKFLRGNDIPRDNHESQERADSSNTVGLFPQNSE